MTFLARKNQAIKQIKFQPLEENMKTVTYTIPNISCGHCVRTIQTELSDLAGVKSVDADEKTKQTVVVFETPATEDQIVALLKEIDYPPA